MAATQRVFDFDLDQAPVSTAFNIYARTVRLSFTTTGSDLVTQASYSVQIDNNPPTVTTDMEYSFQAVEGISRIVLHIPIMNNPAEGWVLRLWLSGGMELLRTMDV